MSYTELMAVSNISKGILILPNIETKTSGMTAKLRRLILEDYKIFRSRIGHLSIENKAKELDSMRR